MTAAQIKADVDRGLEIVARIESDKAELKAINARLENAALHGDQVELNDAEREGRQFIACGSDLAVPVVLTADLIQQTFADKSPAHARIEAAAGDKIGLFYRAKTTWEALPPDGKAFRREAAALLGEAAPAFITACLARDKTGTPKSAVKVEWDRKAKPEQLTP